MKLYRIIILAFVIAAASSCAAYKRLGILQDMKADVEYSMPTAPAAKIAKGDKLSIQVHCPTPELAAPFNVMNGIFIPEATSASGRPIGVKVSEGVEESNSGGFEVNQDGNISYPVLGEIHVEGLTLKEVRQAIETQIVDRKLIKEPIVDVKFTNFKYTILGESGKGVYNAPDGEMNILDALADAGGIFDDGIRDEVWVIRSDNGKRRLYTINLKSKDCFYSPAFFLRQNDLIYVKPRNGKFDETVRNTWTVVSSVSGALGVGISTAILVNNLLRK